VPIKFIFVSLGKYEEEEFVGYLVEPAAMHGKPRCDLQMKIAVRNLEVSGLADYSDMNATQ